MFWIVYLWRLGNKYCLNYEKCFLFYEIIFITSVSSEFLSLSLEGLDESILLSKFSRVGLWLLGKRDFEKLSQLVLEFYKELLRTWHIFEFITYKSLKGINSDPNLVLLL